MVARIVLFGVCFAISSSALPQSVRSYGHSRHGEAFDSGMRQKPWRMEGLGNAPFPITTKNFEVQEWFNQANALLDSFWEEEAERTLRWCLKLEPENAMVYWCLARGSSNWGPILWPSPESEPNMQRARAFLKEAVKRKHNVSERERLYIEAWDATFAATPSERGSIIVRKLQEICLKFPDDVEAKVQLAFYNIGQGSQLANELLIQEVLRQNPMHPGAHHARIHTWDSVDSAQSIASCETYSKVAPNVGHALHMPGHIYSKIGMWHEAAYAMDSATRIELRYLNERLALPFETWNYPHNRNYLCYIQEQLGMAEASIRGARDLLRSPADPGNPAATANSEGIIALCRALVKFERWDDLLKPGVIPWLSGDEPQKLTRAFVETVAHVEKGQLDEAREKFAGLKALTEPVGDNKAEPDESKVQLRRIAEGLLRSAEGKSLDAQRLLLAAMESEAGRRSRGEYTNDPPNDPWPVARLVGDLYRIRGDHKLAIEAYEEALRFEQYDAFTLASLAASHKAIGNTDKAARYYGMLLHVWSNADPGLRWMEEAKALGLKSIPIADTPATERKYNEGALDKLGPSNWTPHAAPKLECLDPDDRKVRLEDFRGKNVLLVFYLSEECAHCFEQLKAINGRAADLESQDTVVLAVSAASPEAHKASQALGGLKMTLLSDSSHENARRFASYDDFEDLELHSTILIDKEGRVRWKRTGGDPFADMDFLIKEIARFSK